MRIVYMLTSLGIGGAEKQAIEIAHRIAARGHDVGLIVLRKRERGEWTPECETLYLEMEKSPIRIARGLKRAIQFLNSFKPDLIHSHTFPANIAARTLRSIGAKPLVLTTIHNIYEGGKYHDLSYRITDRFSTHTTAVSTSIADRCVLAKAMPRRKCSVITNGIDTAVFSPSGSTVQLKTKDRRNRFTWLAAGRDVPAKDYDNLLAAFRGVRAQAPSTELCIVGQPGDHRTRGELCNASGVRWLGVSREMAETIARCDAFVLSSAWEGMPLVVGEAMAMEKPVVVTDVGGVRELVGDSGIIVPSQDSRALAEAMLRLMRMPESDRASMGKAARKRIICKFEIHEKANEWEALYSRILASR
jgi:glycosyltransferase involved in cell wall biosynthesis